MSTYAQSSDQPDVQQRNLDLRDSPAEEPFLDDIWHDRQVCNHCYARVGETFVDVVQKTSHDVVHESFHESASAMIGFDLVDAPESVVSNYPKPEARRTCGECGSVGMTAQYDTLSKHEAINRVPALAARLSEAGHTVNREKLFSVVRHLKSDPSMRGWDTEIFATAAAVATSDGRSGCE